ncbi:MAG: alcohol dehydrogenase catalytic domain-containing protein [Parvibaculum sp.]
MRQLTFVEAKRFEWRDVAAPAIETGKDAIVEPLAVARCDLDYYIAIGAYGRPGPYAFGHEMVAVVREIGDKVKTVAPGDRVIVPFQINCGECTNCRRGWTNACEAVPSAASFGLGTGVDRDFGGAFSDLVRVPFADAMLVPLPASVAPETACLLGDNVADGYRTVAAHLARFPGAPVLVAGGLAQSVGLYAAQTAVALGAERVVYTDFDDTRLALARGLGAEARKVDYSAERRHDDSFLITVDASSMAEGLSYAFRSTAACGFCTGVAGGLTAMTPLPLAGSWIRGITYEVSRVHSRASLPHVLGHVCDGTLHPETLVARTASFDDAIEAMFDPAPKIVFSKDGM